MNIGYVAPLSATGYSQAARSYISALHRQPGVRVHVHLTTEDTTSDFGEEGRLMQSLASAPLDLKDCDVVIHQREPGHCAWVPGVPNVCYTVWEADAIPERWRWILNDKAAEVWVPSQFNVDVFQSSGVVRPVVKVPHIVDPQIFNQNAEPKYFRPADLSGRRYFFYMGPWDSRKNPQDLLRAYYRAFSHDDQILLVMRSYGGMHAIEHPAPSIRGIRDEFNGKKLPPLLFLGSNLPNRDISWLHRNALAFVSMSHSEGWGLGHSQSLALGVPVVSVKWGGSLEFQNDANSFLIKTPGLIPTSGFPNPTLYDANRMRWAQGDIDHAAELLRQAYLNPAQCSTKGRNGQTEVFKKFNYDVIGRLMLSRLHGITK